MLPPAISVLPSRTREFGSLLEQWCNINSGSGNADGLDRMRAALRAEYAHRFPAAKITEIPTDAEPFNPAGTRALSVSMRASAPVQVLFSGHYDTVYSAADSFQSCQWTDDDTLNGPGVADMKGGLVTMLAALDAVEQTPHAATIGWEVLLTPDEETGSHGSGPLFVAAAKRHRFAFVFEPARPSGDIVHSRKGTGNLVATCRGRAAHAAKVPNDGRNAILALAEFLLGAAKIPAEMPGILVNVGNIRGGGPATNVVPDLAVAEIDVRSTKVDDRAPLMKRFDELAAAINAREGLQLEVSGGFNRPPKECLPAEERVFTEWQRAASDLGVPPFSWIHAGGGSDGNLLAAAGVPNLDGVGPIGDHLHSHREYCKVNSIAQRAQIAALFLHRVAGGEIKL